MVLKSRILGQSLEGPICLVTSNRGSTLDRAYPVKLGRRLLYHIIRILVYRARVRFGKLSFFILDTRRKKSVAELECVVKREIRSVYFE